MGRTKSGKKLRTAEPLLGSNGDKWAEKTPQGGKPRKIKDHSQPPQ